MNRDLQKFEAHDQATGPTFWGQGWLDFVTVGTRIFVQYINFKPSFIQNVHIVEEMSTPLKLLEPKVVDKSNGL